MADIDGLGANFPWESLVLRLLGWVRLRNKELRVAVESLGGISTVVASVKTEMEQPEPVQQAASAPRESPRKKKSSFSRRRRRSSQKFDPNADVDITVVDKLIAKERSAAIQPQPSAPVLQPEEDMQEEEYIMPEVGVQEEAQIPQPEVDVQDEVPVIPEEQDERRPPIDHEPERIIDEMEAEEVAGPSQRPQSTADTLRLLKQKKKQDKENRSGSLFERQANARRVDFGDGFGEDTQRPSAPSRKGKEPQRSPQKKRQFPAGESDDDDDDTFEAIPRAARVQEQRERAKRVRIEPTSSNAPTSHQPQPIRENVEVQPIEQEESPSENEEPEMTEEAEEACPRSTFADQRDLARANNRPDFSGKPRKARTAWDENAEEALIEYMALYPRAYSQILKYDEITYGLLQDRTQVNLKDKARNMAIVMIK